MLDGEEDEAMWIFLKEWLGGKMALYFGFFVMRYFFGRRRRFGGFPHGRRVSGGPAKVFPVVAVVTDEVRDLAEGLVRDGVLEGHGEDSRFWRWMERDVYEVFSFLFLVCVVVLFGLCVVRSRCGAGFLLF